jgi:hypothetical protein
MPAFIALRYGMVGSLEVLNLKLDVLGMVVVPRFPEGNWQDH